MRSFLLLFGFAFAILPSVGRSEFSVYPKGNCYSRAQMKKLDQWCAANRRLPMPKPYLCVDDDDMVYGIDVAAHNYQVRLRVEGKRRNPVMLSCAEYCGYDPYLARTVGNFSFASADGDSVLSLIYCHCPNLVGKATDRPPTPSSLRLEARKYREWAEIAQADRECSGRRRDVGTDEHNAKISGRRCSETQDLRLECPQATIDHCSVYLSPNDVGAMPWTHRCEAYPVP